MENQLTRVTRRARAGKDTITFPKLQDQVRATRLNIARTHVPGKHRAHLTTTDTANKPANDPVTTPGSTTTKPTAHHYNDRSKKISPTTSGTVHVRAVITETTMGDHDTPQRNTKTWHTADMRDEEDQVDHLLARHHDKPESELGPHHSTGRSEPSSRDRDR